jgi:hypothetical protein
MTSIQSRSGAPCTPSPMNCTVLVLPALKPVSVIDACASALQPADCTKPLSCGAPPLTMTLKKRWYTEVSPFV